MEWCIRHCHGKPRLIRKHPVEIAQQRPAARQGDPAIDHVRGDFWLHLLERRANRLDDLRDGLAESFDNFGLRER